MAKANTVMGPIPAEELGIVAIHAHARAGHDMPGREPDTSCSEALSMAPSMALEQRYAEAVPTLRQFRKYGGETLVDATSVHSGREVEYYKLLSARTGVLIVASTGFNGGDTVGSFFGRASLDYLTQYFIREITIGIDDTDTRAGLIAIGASHAGRTTELDTRIHRAAARAAATTGAPILMTTPAIDPHTAIAIFDEEGLPLHRVLFGYTHNDTHDTWVVEQGGRIGFNTLGTLGHEPQLEAPPGAHNQRLEHLLRLIRAGHLDKALASTLAGPGALDGPGPAHTVNHIFTDLIPGLRHTGLDESTITTLLIDNPAEFLTLHS